MGFKSIAIDGPSGAGKSTMARRVAEKLNFLYVDTGAIYRTLGLFALQSGVDLLDRADVVALLPQAVIRMEHGPDGLQRMYLCTEKDVDVTEVIRTPEVSKAASCVSAYPEVRSYLMEMQRELARTHNVVMDGRDIGTVVLPGADVKIFLTASAAARARRRCNELKERGTPQEYETVLSEIMARDQKDISRTTAPLKQAEDAVVVDTTELDLEQSVQTLLTAIMRRLNP